MSDHPTLRICLEPALLKSAAAGGHNFINIIQKTAENARFRVEFCPIAALSEPVSSDVYTLSHMKQPPPKRGLVFRRVYHYPFWQIDPSAERWHWDVAKAQFDPAQIEPDISRKFAGFWRKRLFGDPALHPRKEGYVYVPLQGRLSAHRSFQSCSPLQMLTHTLAHCGARKVIATLHPKESYTQAEMTALERLQNQHPNLTIGSGEMIHHLQHCDYVVTQNSSAAFNGYFFGKSALLFAGIDFHHIAVQADMSALERSFAQVAAATPDFDRYLWWFWQDRSINGGKEDAASKILARFKKYGWPTE